MTINLDIASVLSAVIWPVVVLVILSETAGIGQLLLTRA
jgi:hypothetical protein